MNQESILAWIVLKFLWRAPGSWRTDFTSQPPVRQFNESIYIYIYVCIHVSVALLAMVRFGSFSVSMYVPVCHRLPCNAIRTVAGTSATLQERRANRTTAD